MILDAAEYLSRLRHTGLFAVGAAEPEHDPRVLEAYLTLEDRWLGHFDREIHLLDGWCGVGTDPFDPEHDGLGLALVAPLVDPCLPLTCGAFAARLPHLVEAAAAAGLFVLTDTFCCLDGYPAAPADHLLAVHSPVARLAPTPAEYLTTLRKHRRARHRVAQARFAGGAFRTEVTAQPLTEDELAFAWHNLERRWGAVDAPYAFAQTLWSHAVAMVLPDRVRLTRVWEHDQLVFVQTMLVRQGGIFAQSIFKSEDTAQDGIAAWVDFATVRACCGGAFAFFDPSCRATWVESGDIGIIKRATVNQDRVKPVLAAGPLPPAIRAALETRDVQGVPESFPDLRASLLGRDTRV